MHRRITFKLALSGIFASIYALLTIALGPIGYYAIQVRVSDALIALSIFYPFETAIGTCIGCVIANMFAPYPTHILDLVLGPLANFLASCLIYAFRKRILFGLLLGSLVIGVIVGGYLWIILHLTPWFTIPTVTLGELVSVFLMGYMLDKALIKLGWRVAERFF